jgi:hypothetical protein
MITISLLESLKTRLSAQILINQHDTDASIRSCFALLSCYFHL